MVGTDTEDEKLMECPECDDREDVGFILSDYKGNGNCSVCHGEGTIPPDAIDGLVSGAGEIYSKIIFLGMADDEPEPEDQECKKCTGTGQCQRCGGKGYIKLRDHSDEDSIDEGEDKEDEIEYSSYDYKDSDYSDPALSQSNYSSENNKSSSSEVQSFFIIIGIVIGAVILITGIRNLQNKSDNSNRTDHRYKSVPDGKPKAEEINHETLQKTENNQPEQKHEETLDEWFDKFSNPHGLKAKEVDCPKCGGDGEVDLQQWEGCKRCSGGGKIYEGNVEFTCPDCNGSTYTTYTTVSGCISCFGLGKAKVYE